MPFTIGLLIGLIAGAVGVYSLLIASGRKIVRQARTDAEAMRAAAKQEAENKAKEIELKAKAEQLELRKQFEKETEGSRTELKNIEQRLNKREDILDKKLDTLTVKERHLEDLESRVAKSQKQVEAKETQVTQVLAEQREKLLQISGMSQEQARETMLRRIEDERKHEA